MCSSTERKLGEGGGHGMDSDYRRLTRDEDMCVVLGVSG
jgi:hypothetical protein